MTNRQVLPFPLKDDEYQVTAEFASPARVLQTLLAEEEGVSPVSAGDQDLFRRFFTFEGEPLYGKSWTYLTQAVNGRQLGFPLGLKYHRKDVLVPIGYFPRPSSHDSTWNFHLVRPMGNWTAGPYFTRLCQRLSLLSKAPVYVKKLRIEEANWLQRWSGFNFIDRYPWHHIAVEEDDTFEEVVLDVSQSLRLLETPGHYQVKDHYRRFSKRYGKGAEWRMYSPALQADARAVVSAFFNALARKPIKLSVPGDYENMIGLLPQGSNGEAYFAYLLYIDGQRAGFCVAERLCQSTQAGVYANIALHEKFPYSSEYLIVELMRKLQDAGINSVNLGGSETRGLHQFKLKFRPVRQEKMHWMVYHP